MARYCHLDAAGKRVATFKIPDGAETDYKGFFKIDAKFMTANPHIDFTSHMILYDLKTRGLNEQYVFYMNNNIVLNLPKYSIKHVRDPLKVKSEIWEENSDHWKVYLKDVEFDYYTGIGHRKMRGALFSGDREQYKRLTRWNASLNQAGLNELLRLSRAVVPDIESVIYCLFSDYQVGQYTHEEYCYTFDVDVDSRKGLETYLACQKSGEKLMKAGFKMDELAKYYEDY